MPDPDSVIPFDRLPPGFADSLDAPPSEPVQPRPAATVVLLRDAAHGPEVLLLRRVRSSGFVPGAYVFPGGRVDADDASAELEARLTGLDASTASARLGLGPDAVPPALAYVLASIREAFEETGLLLASDEAGRPVPSAAVDPRVAAARDRLLADESAFVPILDELGARLHGAAVAYIAHWITPVVEPRRYDTRFFAAAVEGPAEVAVNPAEMSDALWLTPGAALDRHREGRLPMVFPTIHTLEALVDFESTSAILDDYRRRPVPPILPRLVKTDRGVGLELDDG
jgi:8-oxo-dGTP pyrophosphatase MutT (NUDIX family)